MSTIVQILAGAGIVIIIALAWIYVIRKYGPGDE